jgi:hypothetical protein
MFSDEELKSYGWNGDIETRDEFEKVHENMQRELAISKIKTDINTDEYSLFELKKKAKLSELKDKFNQIKIKPRVEIPSLGFYVDGGRENKDDFKTKWEIMNDDSTTTVRDADDNYHFYITKSQMEVIWKTIAINGDNLYSWKWYKESQISSCFTDEELEAIDLEFAN